MVVLIVRRAWPVVVPHTDLATGLYFALLLVAALGGMGRLQAGLASWGMVWWQRRRGGRPLSTQGEALIILLGLAVVWVGTLALIIVLVRASPE